MNKKMYCLMVTVGIILDVNIAPTGAHDSLLQNATGDLLVYVRINDHSEVER